MLKKISQLLSIATIIATTSFAADYTINFTHVVSPESPKGKAADFFAKRVQELTGGKVEVKVYPNSTLFNDATEMEAILENKAQMAAPSLSKFPKLVPQTQLFDLPFLFSDAKHLHTIFEGEVGRKVRDFVIRKGFIALNYWDNGFKHFSSNKKPILTPEDGQGQSFRIQPSKVLEKQFEAIGGTPKVIAFGKKTYEAMQSGEVDGTENPLSNFWTQKYYEQQTSLTLSGHGYLGYLVVMNKEFWSSLPSEFKPKIVQAMNEASEYNNKISTDLEKEFLANIKKYEASSNGKFKIYNLTPDQVAKWSSHMEKIYPEFYKVIGEDLILKVKKSR